MNMLRAVAEIDSLKWISFIAAESPQSASKAYFIGNSLRISFPIVVFTIEDCFIRLEKLNIRLAASPSPPYFRLIHPSMPPKAARSH
jgi:hypothetical protein